MCRHLSSRLAPLLLALTGLVGACRRAARANLGASGTTAEAALVRAFADGASWASYGRDHSNQRYSPLRQLRTDTDNVRRLTLAWRYHTGLPHAFEASPLVADGVMYVSTPLNHIVALDASTGRGLWEFAETLSTTVHCCGAVNRGVAAYGGRVYMGTLDGRLVALDARTGQTWPSGAFYLTGEPQYGPLSAVDLRTGRIAWHDRLADPLIGGALATAGGLAFTGTKDKRFLAFDARSGTQLWRYDAHTTGLPDAGSALMGLNFVPTAWAPIDSLIVAGIPEAVARSAIGMPARGGKSDLTPPETWQIAAYVWAISQTRGEPWPGGHASHAASVPPGIDHRDRGTTARGRREVDIRPNAMKHLGDTAPGGILCVFALA